MPVAPLARLPKAALVLVREAARHLLRRLVVAVCAVARTSDGRYLLIRRADTGTWALPGGTVEWGESLREALPREVREEAGAEIVRVGDVTGVYSRPDRDPRFHAVTVVVACDVLAPTCAPTNPLEILEVGLFDEASLPAEMAMGMREMLDHARASKGVAYFE